MTRRRQKRRDQSLTCGSGVADASGFINMDQRISLQGRRGSHTAPDSDSLLSSDSCAVCYARRARLWRHAHLCERKPSATRGQACGRAHTKKDILQCLFNVRANAHAYRHQRVSIIVRLHYCYIVIVSTFPRLLKDPLPETYSGLGPPHRAIMLKCMLAV